MSRIILASKSPPKLFATEQGFFRMFPNVEHHITCTPVPSGVSNQPMGDLETVRGALGRVRAAREAVPEADFWVGLEGGVEDREDGMVAFAWAVVEQRDGRVGKGKTGSFYLPPEVTRLVRNGVELGDADDQVFSRHGSKNQNGAVGILTGDVLTRGTFYADAVLLALIPFKHPHLF